MKAPRNVVSVAMSPELLARLDAKRGAQGRSGYIQNLIRRDVYAANKPADVAPIKEG